MTKISVSQYLWPHWKKIIFLLFSMGLKAFYFVSVPLVTKAIIDSVSKEENHDFLLYLLIAMAALFIISSLCNFWNIKLRNLIAIDIVNRLRLQMIKKLYVIDSDYFIKHKAGDIISRFDGDISVIRNTLAGTFPVIVISCLQILLSLISLFFVNSQMVIVALIFLPLIALSAYFFIPKARYYNYQWREQEGKLNNEVIHHINYYRLIRINRLAQFMQSFFSLRQSKLKTKFLNAKIYSAMAGQAAFIMLDLTTLLILSIGGYLVIIGKYSVGSLVAFIGLMAIMGSSTRTLSRTLPSLLAYVSSRDRIVNLLSATEENKTLATKEIKKFVKTLTIKDLSFSYDNKIPILKDINLIIDKGQAVAIVGHSGSGKSTFLELLLGFKQPMRGKILVDGIDIRFLNKENLYSLMGVVFQDIELLNLTIKDNIALDSPNYDMNQIIYATSQAGIHDKIMSLPKQYDTVLGDVEGQLSGGEKQRIAIARALFKKPAFLIFDEATSGLDLGSEQVLYHSLNQLKGKTTLIVVTHRLHQLNMMDNIFVFADGSIVEVGKHHHLLKKQGLYYSLWKTQLKPRN